MKIIIFLIINFLFVCSTFGQEINNAKIINKALKINTINGNSISIEFEIDWPDNESKEYKIDDESFHRLNPNLNLRLGTKKYSELLNNGEQIDIGITKNQIITFDITNLSDEFMNLLEDKTLGFYIKIDEDIVFEIIKNKDETTLKKFKITKLQIEENSKNKSIILTDQMAKELIDAKGGEIFLTENKFDFGIIPAEQSSSSKTEFNAAFFYRTKYSFLNEKLPIFFSSEGLIGSNSKDSLNHITIYPINYNFFKGTNELVGQLGIEGNQVFSNYRISGNFSWNAIIPNIIDLTFGEDRLRLKPVIKTGIKFYQEIENNRSLKLDNNEFSNQVFGEFYYYIPIQKIYSLILEGTAFYDFNPNVNPDKKMMFNYSAILGIDIPKTEFKTIFKYSKGENGISYQKNDYLMIGLMIDAFGLN
jgi:hypothetical protein